MGWRCYGGADPPDRSGTFISKGDVMECSKDGMLALLTPLMRLMITGVEWYSSQSTSASLIRLRLGILNECWWLRLFSRELDTDTSIVKKRESDNGMVNVLSFPT